MMFVAWKKLGLLFFYFLCEHTSVEISILQQDWKFNVIVLVVGFLLKYCANPWLDTLKQL